MLTSVQIATIVLLLQVFGVPSQTINEIKLELSAPALVVQSVQSQSSSVTFGSIQPACDFESELTYEDGNIHSGIDLIFTATSSNCTFNPSSSYVLKQNGKILDRGGVGALLPGGGHGNQMKLVDDNTYVFKTGIGIPVNSKDITEDVSLIIGDATTSAEYTVSP